MVELYCVRHAGNAQDGLPIAWPEPPRTTARRRGESIRRAVVRLRRIRRSEVQVGPGLGTGPSDVGGPMAQLHRQNQRLPAAELPVAGVLVLEQPDVAE